MSKCPGLHCEGCSTGSGWGDALVMVVVIAVVGSLVIRAAEAVGSWVMAALPWIIGGAGVILAGSAALAVAVIRRRRRARVSWQLGRTAIRPPRAPQLPPAGPGAIVPGVVIHPAPRQLPRPARGRQLPRQLPTVPRPRAASWPHIRPDGGRDH